MDSQDTRRKLKKIVGRILNLGILDATVFFLKKVRKHHNAVILLYHRIFEDENNFLFKNETVHRNIRGFEKDIRYLKKRYEIISLDKLVEHLQMREPFKAPSIVITFDDGYADNYGKCFQILKQNKVPATIFLVSCLIGSSNMTWTEELSYRLLISHATKLKLPRIIGGQEISIGDKDEKRIANIKLAEQLKKIPNQERVKAFKEIINRLNENQQNQWPEHNVMLDWKEVCEMAKNGVTFGAHTHTHPILSKLDETKAREEIRLSKEIIEQQIGRPVYHFAFPNGRNEDFTEGLRLYCREIGFKSVLSAEYGNTKSESNPFSLNRVGIDPDFPCWVLDIARLLFLS